MSISLWGEVFTFTQPDGNTFQGRVWGDQRYAFLETLDEFAFVKDLATGFYQYATISDNGKDLVPTGYQVGMVDPHKLGITKRIRTDQIGIKISPSSTSRLLSKMTRWETRREVSRMKLRSEMLMEKEILLAPPRTNRIGDFVGLCLVIEFPDVPSAVSKTEIEAFCNSQGYNQFGNNGSVYDYFFDNSRGKLRYTNIVAPLYTAKYRRAYYTDEKQEPGVRAQELIRENLDYLRANGFDFGRLTTDSENIVYATNVFYAGEIVNNWAQGLWPHSARLDPVYDLIPGITFADYQFSNIGNELKLAIFCHENGHMICDFPDLYDLGKDQKRSFGVGGFCLMCFGGMVDMKNPAQIGAYLKYKAGWSDSLTTITNGLNATIHAGRNDFFMYSKNMSEYFIIENRYQSGRDRSLPGSGLTIWHVDELASNENQDRLPNSHYECSLVQADGQYDLEQGVGNRFGENKDLFYAPDNKHFGDSTQPNSRWWDGTSSGLEVTFISESGISMQFKNNV